MPLELKNILVVDDAPFIIERMLELLKEIPGVGDTRAAGNYEEAMAIFPAFTIHILLADIHLPGKNGLELLKQVRAIYPSITVIMVSNMNSSYYRKACSDAGAEQLIDKSKAFDLLPDLLKKYL